MFVVVSSGAKLVASGSFLNAAWQAFCPLSSIPWTRCVHSAQSDGWVLLLRTGAPQSLRRCHSLPMHGCSACETEMGPQAFQLVPGHLGIGGGLTALVLMESL